MSDILNFTETPIIDESIEAYEYHEYNLITGTNLNNGGDIGISIESKDMFAHPSESYLIFEGHLTKADCTVYRIYSRISPKILGKIICKSLGGQLIPRARHQTKKNSA